MNRFHILGFWFCLLIGQSTAMPFTVWQFCILPDNHEGPPHCETYDLQQAGSHMPTFDKNPGVSEFEIKNALSWTEQSIKTLLSLRYILTNVASGFTADLNWDRRIAWVTLLDQTQPSI
jgi:hypothetical protein